ncbi:MAG: hypothetical protein FWE21_10815, partial [Defluviitaleaceae bacterium]|nr:hypothetical protein [Defluviitaleaceae bacterium]
TFLPLAKNHCVIIELKRFNNHFVVRKTFLPLAKNHCVIIELERFIPIPIRNMEKDILKIAGFSAFSKCAFP